jgi:hypothetical protein
MKYLLPCTVCGKERWTDQLVNHSDLCQSCAASLRYARERQAALFPKLRQVQSILARMKMFAQPLPRLRVTFSSKNVIHSVVALKDELDHLEKEVAVLCDDWTAEQLAIIPCVSTQLRRNPTTRPVPSHPKASVPSSGVRPSYPVRTHRTPS